MFHLDRALTPECGRLHAATLKGYAVAAIANDLAPRLEAARDKSKKADAQTVQSPETKAAAKSLIAPIQAAFDSEKENAKAVIRGPECLAASLAG